MGKFLSVGNRLRVELYVFLLNSMELSMKSDLDIIYVRTFHENFLRLKFINWRFHVLWLTTIKPKKKLVNNSMFRHDFFVQTFINDKRHAIGIGFLPIQFRLSRQEGDAMLLYFSRYHRSSALNFLRSKPNWRSRQTRDGLKFTTKEKGNPITYLSFAFWWLSKSFL